MKKTIIKQLGMGQGAGEEIEVIAREEIEKIIDELEFSEVIKVAYDGFNKGYKTGYAAINLENGNLYSESLGQNEENQACDNNFVTVYKFDQNFDIGDLELDDESEDSLIEYLEYSDSIDDYEVKTQLDMYYNDDD